jgi:hypothetical protein
VGIDHLKIFSARKEFEGPLKQLEAGFPQSGKSVPPEIRQLRARYDEVLGRFALAQLTRRKPLVQLNKGGPSAVLGDLLGEVRTLATSFPLRHDRIVALCAEFDLVFSRLQRELSLKDQARVENLRAGLGAHLNKARSDIKLLSTAL